MRMADGARRFTGFLNVEESARCPCQQRGYEDMEMNCSKLAQMIQAPHGTDEPCTLGSDFRRQPFGVVKCVVYT